MLLQVNVMFFQPKERLAPLLGILLLFVSLTYGAKTKSEDGNASENFDRNTHNLVRFRGFNAENHFITTTDGYILNVIRATNPYIRESQGMRPTKEPIIFFHGTTNANSWLVNSEKVEPKNYCNLDAGNMSIEELEKLLLDDPASKSLAFTTLNFGHEIWLVNRRGTTDSLGHIDEGKVPFINPVLEIRRLIRKKLKRNKRQLELLNNAQASSTSDLLGMFDNPKYWRFSLDEQAQYDVPEIIDYVLNQTHTNFSKVSLVGHSAGASLILLANSIKPELKDKVRKTLVLAPEIHEGGIDKLNPLYPAAHMVAYLMADYPGAIFKFDSLPFVKNFYAALCTPKLLRTVLCDNYFNFLFGDAGHQNEMKPGFLQPIYSPLSSPEFGSKLQSILKNKSHKLDYGDAIANLIKYNEWLPPAYNLSRITTTGMSLWFGNKDSVVPQKVAHSILEEIKVPYETRTIGEGDEDVRFNHIGFLVHQKVAKLFVIPALKTLESH